MRKFNYMIVILIIGVLLTGCKATPDSNGIPYLSNTVMDRSFINGNEIEFSLNGGADFIQKDCRLEHFDILNSKQNEEVTEMVFFYAYNYDEFLDKINAIKTQSWPDNDTLRHLTNSYDKEYFEENIILYYHKHERYISPNYIYSVTKTDNVLTLNVNRLEGDATALSDWREIITIRKEHIKNVDKINVIVRTVAPLQKSIMISVSEDYVRELYINDFNITDFNGLKNLKAVTTFMWSLNVDIVFNEYINDEDYNYVINFLEKSPCLKSIGYKGKDFIRVQFIGKFYDDIVNKTLTFADFSAEQLSINYNLSLKILTFKPFGFITFEMETPGRDMAEAMIKELIEMNLPFLDMVDAY